MAKCVSNISMLSKYSSHIYNKTCRSWQIFLRGCQKSFIRTHKNVSSKSFFMYRSQMKGARSQAKACIFSTEYYQEPHLHIIQCMMSCRDSYLEPLQCHNYYTKIKNSTWKKSLILQPSTIFMFRGLLI